jgi:hypothetical protein
MSLVPTGRRVCDVMKTRILYDDKGIAVRGQDGTPIIAEEILYTNDLQQTLSKNCHAGDKAMEVIKLERDIVVPFDHWQ